jgi:hypothetical protein
MQHRRSSTEPPSALSVSFQLSMHRSPSSRGGGGAAVASVGDARTMTTTTTTSTTSSACAFDSTAAAKVRLCTDSSRSNENNNQSINGDESGYGSDSSPDGAPNEDLTDSSSGGEGGAPRTRLFAGQTADYYDDDDCDNNSEEDTMRERIYFLREKQQILERAGNVLNRRAERNYAAAVASDLCHGLATESSSSASSNSSSSSSGSEDNGEKEGLKKRKRRTGNIWVEARRVLAEMNKRAGSGGDGDDDSGPAFPVPTSIYRKRCAPTPIHPLINTGIVQRVRSKTYDSSSEAETAPARAGSPLPSSNQVRLTDTLC